MKPSHPWRRRLFLGATILAVVLLCAHPELRLFVPIVDAFGIDLFALLVGAQVWDYARPMAHWARDKLAMPVALEAYEFTILMLGYMGQYLDLQVSIRLGRSLVPA